MLCLFFCFGICGWWNYVEEEFPLLEAESMTKPIFLVCTMPTCPHCKGMPDALKDFSSRYRNRDNIVFSHVDCTKSQLCLRVGIYGVPSFVLVRGTQPKYWPSTFSRNADGWTRFINSHVGVKANRINNEGDIKNYVKKVEDGGSVFILTIPNENHEILSRYHELASEFHIYSCNLGFILNSSIQAPTIAVYFSPNCSLTQKILTKDLRGFLMNNKFSYFHRYDFNEFQQEKKNSAIVVVASDGAVKGNNLTAIGVIGSSHCLKSRFGWFLLHGKDESEMTKFTNMKKSDSPYVVAVNEKKSKKMISRDSLTNLEKNGKLKQVFARGRAFVHRQPQSVQFKFFVGLVTVLVVAILSTIIVIKQKTPPSFKFK